MPQRPESETFTPETFFLLEFLSPCQVELWIIPALGAKKIQ